MHAHKMSFLKLHREYLFFFFGLAQQKMENGIPAVTRWLQKSFISHCVNNGWHCLLCMPSRAVKPGAGLSSAVPVTWKETR